MIKYRIMVPAVASLALALTGCSSTGSAEGENVAADGAIAGTLTGIFDTQYKNALDPIIADFEAKYPDVTVDIDYQGGDIAATVLTSLQAGTAPDVLLAFPGGEEGSTSANVTPLAAAGRIVDIEADWADDVPEAWKSQFFYDDKLYAFPGALQPLAAVYNQSLLDELGLEIPTTLDDVLQLCADATDNGVYAYAQGLGDTSAGPQMLSFAQTASLIYGADPTWDQGLATGDVTYPGSGWEDQFGIYQEMFEAGCFGEGALGRSRTQGQEAVAQRQALGLVDVGAVLAGIEAANPDDTFVISAIPATNDGKSSITALPGYVLVVNAEAENMEAAKAFVAFAGEPAESAKFATGFGTVPVVPSAEFEAPENLKEFADLVSAGKTAPLAALTPEVQTTLNQGVQSLLLGNDTPATVAQKMQDAYGR